MISAICLQCAQIYNPTGGYKDINPPILDTTKNNAIPPNYCTNFTSKEISLFFNEFVQLDNPAKNIIITPPLKQSPQYRLRGKKLIVSFNESLLENTTYTVNFGNAIKDITEGNYLKNFSYIFSTGSFIDSMSIQGSVFNAFTKGPAENATIMLYNDDSDSVIIKAKPLYFTKSSITGAFKLSFLKEGVYRIIALTDANNNYKYDRDENIGFLDSLITIGPADTNDIRLLVSPSQESKQMVLSKSFINEKILIAMSQPSDSLILKSEKFGLISNDNIFYNESRDTISCWLDSTNRGLNSLSIIIADNGNHYIDTFKINKVERKTSQIVPLIRLTNLKQLYAHSAIEITSSTPISLIDKSKIILTSENDTIPFSMEQIDKRKVHITAKWKAGNSYSFSSLPGAFIDLYSKSSDSITTPIKIKEINDAGQLLLHLTLPQNQYIFQLIKNTTVINDSVFEGASFNHTYKFLEQGNYFVRLIFDDNKNGVWDSGDYWKKIQPERVENYESPINIRPGWDMDVTWELKK